MTGNTGPVPAEVRLTTRYIEASAQSAASPAKPMATALNTALNVGPDWTTIASYLQAELNRLGPEKTVKIYNFGRGSYFSTRAPFERKVSAAGG